MICEVMNFTVFNGYVQSINVQKNSKGPKIDLCGTPIGIDAHSELQPFIETNCCLSLR